MAAGTIISVLTKIPWGQVMDNAPKLAEGATRLWNAVTRKKPSPLPDSTATAVADAATADAEELKRRLMAMQEHILRLEEQMGASAELIKALAEQNTQLVSRIELGNVRLMRLAAGAAIVTVGLFGAIAYLALRP